MIIAFDYDGVVSENCIQELVKKLLREKNEIWIVTMRSDNYFNNKVIASALNKISMTKHNVMFCNNKPKVEVLQMLNADIYVDNKNYEFENILRQTNIIPLLFINT